MKVKYKKVSHDNEWIQIGDKKVWSTVQSEKEITIPLKYIFNTDYRGHEIIITKQTYIGEFGMGEYSLKEYINKEIKKEKDYIKRLIKDIKRLEDIINNSKEKINMTEKEIKQLKNNDYKLIEIPLPNDCELIEE